MLLPLLFVAVGTAVSLVIADKAISHRPLPVAVVEEPVAKYVISPYDELLQLVGEEYGIDWILLSAIASAESEFRFDAVSSAGAVGLMQIMPAVARNMGYTRESLFDARISAEVASQLLIENNKMLHLPSEFDSTERLHFILACYNAGYSRIADARRLARYHDDDADTWGVVATYLSLLAEPEYAEHEVVSSGIFYGSDETIAYVSKVMHLYNIYRNRIFK